MISRSGAGSTESGGISMNDLKKFTIAFYSFSGGCLLSSALTFFESCKLSRTLFFIAAIAFIAAVTLEFIVCPIYAAILRKKLVSGRTDYPITITGFLKPERKDK